MFEYFSDQILVQNEIKRSGLSHIEQIADQVQLLKVAQNLPNLLKDDDFTNNSLFRNLPFTANNVMPKAKAVVETCVIKSVLFIQSFEHKAQEFKPSYHIKQIIENCSLTKYQKDLPNLTFKNSFQISLTACLLAYAMPIFDKMQERFENKEDIKELYWTLFKSVVKREECEQIQATLFVKILENLSTEKI